MNQQYRHRHFTAGNPLANILVVIAGIIIISLSLALGFFVFLGIAGFVLFMAAVIGIRNWWYQRRFGVRPKSPPRRETPGGKEVIEGEYREIPRHSGDRRDH